ncbi:MAG: hypothetical protein JWN50_636 [Parcubacteria group bacterium]|nr:hypothetical protein [Parcubacteria group bacterium]
MNLPQQWPLDGVLAVAVVCILLGASICFSILVPRMSRALTNRFRELEEEDEGKVGYVAVIWSDPSLGVLYTILLEPDSLSPKVVVIKRSEIAEWLKLSPRARIAISGGHVVPTQGVIAVI